MAGLKNPISGWFSLAVLAVVCGCTSVHEEHFPNDLVATYSIVAFDPATGDLGVAVQSKFFGVGSVVPWAKAKAGAIATQSFANTTYGPRGLELLASGRKPQQVVEELTGSDDRSELRQLGIISVDGTATSFTGSKCQPWAGHFVGTNFAVQGNLLASGAVVTNMAAAFMEARQAGSGELAEWLMAALHAAEKAGGDRRGRQSAALLVVREDGGYGHQNDRYVDLRVEDHPDPLVELDRLLTLHRQFYPQRRKK